jgi:hypothetical protein
MLARDVRRWPSSIRRARRAALYRAIGAALATVVAGAGLYAFLVLALAL